MLRNTELAEIEALLIAQRPNGSSVASPRERSRLEAMLTAQAEYERERPWAKYRYDPMGYCRDILGVRLTAQQERIFLALFEPPYRVHVDSAHSTGKSFLAAVVANFWYDVFDPGVVLTTAPTYEHVVNILWAEIRLIRGRSKVKLPMNFIGPRAPEMRTDDEHWAKGLTASAGETFQGRHRERMLFLFDESEGLAGTYYEVTTTMFQPDGKHAWLSICNPTTRSSPAYIDSLKSDAAGKPAWRVFSLSALDHPNIEAELSGRPVVIPGAVSVGQIEQWIMDYRCAPVEDGDQEVGDFKFPPDKECDCLIAGVSNRDCPTCQGTGTVSRGGRWWRPGPEAEPRILGRRPTVGSSGVWNEMLWGLCEKLVLPFPRDEMPELGCDVARVLGGDDCDIHVRWGGVSLHHESANGRSIPATAGRLKEVANQWCEWANVRRLPGVKEFYPTKLAIKIDDGGIGNSLIDLAGGYQFVPVNAAHTAHHDQKYPNTRSELWFETAEQGRLGGISLSMLPQEWREKLRIQALAPLWAQDARGRRVVEKKDQTKGRLGRSPDGMDAFNLAYYRHGATVPHWIGDASDGRFGETAGSKMGLLGRGPNADGEEQRRDYGRQHQSGKFRTLGRGMR